MPAPVKPRGLPPRHILPSARERANPLLAIVAQRLRQDGNYGDGNAPSATRRPAYRAIDQLTGDAWDWETGILPGAGRQIPAKLSAQVLRPRHRVRLRGIWGTVLDPPPELSS